MKMKIDDLNKEIDKRKTVEGNQKEVEENKKGFENNQNSFYILPILPIYSFTILRLLLSIFSCFIYFNFINLDLNYLIPNIPEVTVPVILTNIVLFVWEYYKLYSKVRKYYKAGKIISMFCKEKLSLIICRTNNYAGKFDGLFNFIATNPLSIIVYTLVVYTLVVFSLLLISAVLVYYFSDFSPYEHYSCHIACDAPRA
ncbi:hypothetical protein K491DRAFT_743622 [Lophiostoma macrostomum CBS 122681]|uniref:Uncharacterized protein n=1 Tax=Lophiostoma macrostomum CBS 122681 TaxID=1314788 RepID=A0A6A6SHJ8_9PLEO|nr:hypothetical protein K491DRAFT_743622 [Lophiostoma macrostomum CBS 122681]